MTDRNRTVLSFGLIALALVSGFVALKPEGAVSGFESIESRFQPPEATETPITPAYIPEITNLLPPQDKLCGENHNQHIGMILASGESFYVGGHEVEATDSRASVGGIEVEPGKTYSWVGDRDLFFVRVSPDGKVYLAQDCTWRNAYPPKLPEGTTTPARPEAEPTGTPEKRN